MIIASGVAWRVNSAAAAVAKAPKSHDPAGLDSLARYLQPLAVTRQRSDVEPVELVERDFGPEPDWAGQTDDGTAGATPQPARARWVVSAILLTDARRMAVVNDAVVMVGSTVPGGGRVLAIEADHVVLQDGRVRHVISLNR